METLSRKIRKKPGRSEEDVHQARILTRRIRAILWLGERLYESKRLRSARKEMKKLGRVLGEQRRWDIARKDAKRFNIPFVPPGKKIEKAQGNLDEALTKQHREKRNEKLERAAKLFEKLPVEAAVAPLRGLENTLKAIPARLPRTPVARHHLRIRVKNVRYLLEELAYSSRVLKKLQDSLGAEHDLIELEKLTSPNAETRKRKRRQVALSRSAVRPALTSALYNLERAAHHLESLH